MNKILMVTTSFPPVGGSHVHRVVNLANSLYEQGFEVHVMTLKPGENYSNIDYSGEKYIREGIKIHYIQEGILHRKNKKEEVGKTTVNKKMKTSIIKKFLLERKKSLLIPDTMIDWFFEVRKYNKQNKLLEEIDPSIILSCSMPNTAHVIGYYLSKKYKKKLFMDYADPWVFEQSVKRGRVRFFIEKLLEQRIISHSNFISFATETTRELYVNKFKLDKKVTEIYYMGFYNQDLKLVDNSQEKKLTLTYGGALNPIHRNPIPFFKALRELSNQEIDVLLRVDKPDLIKESLIELDITKNIMVKGYIPFDDYLEEAMDLDVLILFGNSSPLQIPGKIFNYISTGKLIFFIKNMVEEDPSAKILKEYGNAIIVDNNSLDIKNGLIKLIDMKKNNKIKQIKITHMDNYTWQEQAKVLSSKIKKIL